METNKLIVACAAIVVTASLGVAECMQETNDLSGAISKGKLIWTMGKTTYTVTPMERVTKFKMGDNEYTGTLGVYKLLTYGTGIVKFPNGNRYEGDVVNGKKHGRGKITLRNGSFYEGDFVNDEKHGRGIERCSNGCSYEGDWENDKRHGRGIERYSDGRSYEGDWENDKRHGIGFETDKNGTILRYGCYVHGEFDSSTAIDRPTPQRSSSSSVPTPGIFLRKCR